MLQMGQEYERGWLYPVCYGWAKRRNGHGQQPVKHMGQCHKFRLANDHVWQCIPIINAKLGLPVSTSVWHDLRQSTSVGHLQLTTGIPVGKPVGMKLADLSFW